MLFSDAFKKGHFVKCRRVVENKGFYNEIKDNFNFLPAPNLGRPHFIFVMDNNT